MRVRGPGMVKFMLTHFNVVLLNLHFIFSPFPWNLFHLPRPTTLQWARVSTMTALVVRPPTQVVGGFTSLFWRADNFMNSHKKRGKSGVKKYYSYFTPRWALSNANRFIAFVHYFEYIVARLGMGFVSSLFFFFYWGEFIWLALWGFIVSAKVRFKKGRENMHLINFLTRLQFCCGQNVSDKYVFRETYATSSYLSADWKMCSL